MEEIRINNVNISIENLQKLKMYMNKFEVISLKEYAKSEVYPTLFNITFSLVENKNSNFNSFIEILWTGRYLEKLSNSDVEFPVNFF